MTKEEMLSAIYEAMADKTLSEGCKYITDIYKCTIRYSDVVQPDNMLYSKENDDFYRIDTIIGHPVLIGSVIEYIDSLETWLDGKDKAQWRQNVFGLLLLWKNRRLDLTEQSDDCIEFVYNLIKK